MKILIAAAHIMEFQPALFSGGCMMKNGFAFPVCFQQRFFRSITLIASLKPSLKPAAD
jgi:hypothetical protein